MAAAGASQLGSSGDLWAFAAICLASGLALGADLALPAAIAADLGERRGQAGACFGVWNFVAKPGSGAGSRTRAARWRCWATCPAVAPDCRPASFAYALLPLVFSSRWPLPCQGAGATTWRSDMKLLFAAALTLGLAGCAAPGWSNIVPNSRRSI